MAYPQSPSPPSSLSSALPTVITPESPSSIRRKPVAVSHIRSVSDDAAQQHPQHYVAVSTSDAEQQHNVNGTKKGHDQTLHILSLWKWELLSLLTSILSLVAIIITLRVYQNDLLTQWKLPISINAIVAILSALLKGSLAMPITEGISQLKWLWFSRQPRNLVDMDTYDKASRGAWGSVVMIAKQFQRGPKSILASAGAVLALVALAVDPFSQASVALQPCWRAAEAASIPRANSYEAHGVHSGAGPSGFTIDAAMNLAAYMGILNPPANHSASVPVSCRTHNCTFPSADGKASFASLGVCVLSWDISDEVETVYNENGKGWNFTLARGIELSPGLLLGSTSTAYPGTSFLPDDGEGPWNRTSLVDVQLLGIKYKNRSATYPEDLLVPTDIEPAAYMFSLLPCVQTLAANFTADGLYREDVLDEQLLHMVHPFKGYQLAPNRTLHDGAWRACAGVANKTDTHTVEVYPPSAQDVVDQFALPAGEWFPPECVYSVGEGAAGALSSLIGPGDFFADRLLSFGDPSELNGKIWLQNLWNSGNMSLDTVTDFARGMARAIGAQMRINPQGNLREARGVTWAKETCIVVEWKYLSFLGTLLGLEMVFLAAVMAVNARSRWGADWKSSTLAVAFQDVGGCSATSKEGGGGGVVSSPEMDKDLKEAAKTMQVSFTDVDGKWQLRKQNTDSHCVP